MLRATERKPAASLIENNFSIYAPLPAAGCRGRKIRGRVSEPAVSYFSAYIMPAARFFFRPILCPLRRFWRVFKPISCLLCATFSLFYARYALLGLFSARYIPLTPVYLLRVSQVYLLYCQAYHKLFPPPLSQGYKKLPGRKVAG